MAASSGVWTLPLTGPVSLSTVFAAPCAPPCSSVGSLTHREACGHRGAACERLWYTACLAVLSSAVNFTGPPSSWLQSRGSMSRRWLWNPEKQDPSPHLGSGFAHPPRRPLLLQGPWLSMHGQTCTRPRECGPGAVIRTTAPPPRVAEARTSRPGVFSVFLSPSGRVRASGAVAGAGLAVPPPCIATHSCVPARSRHRRPSGWPASRCGAQAWQPHFPSGRLSALRAASCSSPVVSVLTVSCQLLPAFQSAPLAAATGKGGCGVRRPRLPGVLTRSAGATP